MARQLPNTEALKVPPLIFMLLYIHFRIATQRSITCFDANMARESPLTEVLRLSSLFCFL